ncbi:MAG: class D beta-lactamase, partial [Magnetococcales bacterium]|nr:class D beta-lactamase [Magnetococcales bacterium]
MVLHVPAQRLLVSDETLCDTRFFPASTFKVVNTLIALETGMVREDELFPWNGRSQPFKTWEKDMTLKEALGVSAVPVFQEIARRIGLGRMKEWVTRLAYGNADIGTVVDRFWLEGPLVISPMEQARFLALLATGRLPISRRSLLEVRRLLPRENLDGVHLYGKTGWAMAERPGIGWYVGWTEKNGEIVTFAVSMVMNSLKDAPMRNTLALEALRHIGVLTPRRNKFRLPDPGRYFHQLAGIHDGTLIRWFR